MSKTERQLGFEAWAKTKYLSASFHYEHCGENILYWNSLIQCAWQAWDAALGADGATSPATSPTPEVSMCNECEDTHEGYLDGCRCPCHKNAGRESSEARSGK